MSIIAVHEIKRQENTKYVLSYGGGVNSTALMILLIHRKLPLDYIIFADTGSERPETYTYLKYAKKYAEKYGIPFKIVKVRNGDSLYDRCKRRKVIPSKTWRWCTRDMKIRPIYAFYRSLKAQICQYVGIDYDEVHRMKDSKADYVNNAYPLIDLKVGRQQCIDIIRKEGLPIPVKSGCYFCPFRNNKDWANLYNTHPELYRKAMALEEKSKHAPTQMLHPLTLRGLAKVIKENKGLPEVLQESPCGSECMI
jgi:3'-phosphoadenosine 5'-phosphosulfate sulfotransferase (PAPS reductase)/FAD synthetase